MKKTLVVFLVMALAISMVACSSKSESNNIEHKVESVGAEQALKKLLAGNEKYLSGSITPDVGDSLRKDLGSPLILVLGHTNCGAVTAATEGGEAGGKIQSIVNEIEPSVQKAKDAGAKDVLSKAIEFNVKNLVDKILSSEIIKEFKEEGKVEVIGGVYDINTGKVAIIE